MFNNLNRKGQIGETVTWIVATVIIIIILTVSIFVATVQLKNDKEIKFRDKTTDVLASKSFFSWLLTEDSEGKIIYEQLRNEENLNEFNGNLASNVFNEFYEEDYLAVWIGIIKSPPFPYVKNDYFGDRPSERRGGDVFFGRRSIPHITQRISLDENKSVEMALKIK